MTHLLWVIDWIKNRRGFPCLFHFITGFYCPGCGGTRAIRALLRGDMVKSFCFHPFVLYAVFAVLVEGLLLAGKWGWRIKEKMQKNKREKMHRLEKIQEQEWGKAIDWKKAYAEGLQKRYGRWVLAALWIVGVNWVVKNGFLLAGVDLLMMLGE